MHVPKDSAAGPFEVRLLCVVPAMILMRILLPGIASDVVVIAIANQLAALGKEGSSTRVHIILLC